METLESLIEFRRIPYDVPPPDEDGLEARSLAWAESVHLTPDGATREALRVIGASECARNAYAYAPPPIVFLAARLITWLYLFDDAYPEGLLRYEPEAMRARNASFLHSLRTGEGSDSFLAPFAGSLLGLLDEAEAHAHPAWRERFLSSMAYYLEGCVEESVLRVARRIPALPEYVALRTKSVGLFPCFDFIELAPGHALDHDAYASGLVRAQRARAANLCAWVNDLYSFRKEKAAGCPCNVGIVLAHENSLERDRDVGLAVSALYNETLTEFLADEAAYVAGFGLDTPVSRYMGALRNWIQGFFEWMPHCVRYRMDATVATGTAPEGAFDKLAG